MPGEPQVTNFIEFNVSDLDAEEPGGILPHNIIPVNTDFVIWCDFVVEYWVGHVVHELMAWIGGDNYRVRYYAEQLGGTNDQLLGEKLGQFTSSPSFPHNYVRADTEFTVTGGINTSGTYRLTCTVDCLDPSGNPCGITGFYEGDVIQIHTT